MLSFEHFIDALQEAGWRGVRDAQHTEIVIVYDEMVSESRKVTEINLLRARVAELEKDAMKWREYQAKKQRLIDAGLGKSPLRNDAAIDAAMQKEKE